MSVIQTSPIDRPYLVSAVTASWAGTHHGAAIPEDARDYWVGKASEPETYSNGRVYVGWNRYWETRMRPDNDGSADPALAELPAEYQPWPPQTPTPTPTPAPEPEPSPFTLEQRVAYLESVLPIYGSRIRAIEAVLRLVGEAMPR